jgi:hypothetical protein
VNPARHPDQRENRRLVAAQLLSTGAALSGLLSAAGLTWLAEGAIDRAAIGDFALEHFSISVQRAVSTATPPKISA